jgi:hypothetical protein
MGMMGGAAPNLRELGPDQRVQKITHCGDTYRHHGRWKNARVLGTKPAVQD